jgi:hypothetical protein
VQPQKRIRLFGRILAAMLILQPHGVVVYAADGDEQVPGPGDVNAEPSDSAPDETAQQMIAAEGRVDPYRDQDFLKSAPLFGSDWRFSFGGYAKVDVIHDFAGTGNDQEFVLATIPVDGNPPPGSYTNIQAAETRFSFDMRNSASKYADDRFFLEMDFFDESNQSSPRLRHAYFQYGNLLAGQTWTLLTELRQLPFLLDFSGGDSILGGRTVQIRWSQANVARDLGWAVSLENFDDGEICSPSDIEGQARADIPRLTAGFTRIWKGVVWSLGGAVTQVKWNGTGATSDESDASYSVTTAGRFFLDEGHSNFVGLGVSYASGSITDIITFANGRVPNAAIDANGELELAKGWNGQVGAHWNWNPVWSSNFSIAYAHLTDVPGSFVPDLIRTGTSIHANLVYSHDERIKAGLEIMHGERENVSGRDGDAQRLQFSLIYYF